MVYESAQFTQYYDPELAARAIAPYANATIGMVGIYQMSFAMSDFIMKKLPDAKYVNASELADRIKVIENFGCGVGLCGACVVHIDGKRVFSCQTQVSNSATASRFDFSRKIRSPATLDF